MDIHTVGKRVSEHFVWVSTPTKNLWISAALGKLSTISLPVKKQAQFLTLQYLSQSSLRNIFLASEQLLPDQAYQPFFDILILNTDQAKIWMRKLQMSQFGDIDSGSRDIGPNKS